MIHFPSLLLGLGIGVFIGAWWIYQVLKWAEDFWNRRLDYWAEQVSELQEQVEELRTRRIPGDEWKDAE